MSVLTLEAKLERTDGSTTWGFRMQGGKDFSSPLTIQRVDPGSLAAKCGLQVGDIILKIGNAATEPLRHKEAKQTIVDSGNRLDLLLQRIRAKRQKNGWGGSGGYDRFNGPQINTNWNPQPAAVSPVAPPAPAGKQNFNPTPRPFGSQAPARPNYENNLSQQTQNLSISSRPAEPLAYQNAAEKYSEQEDPQDPSQYQSKSFKYLQNLMDEGRELNTALKPRNTAASMPSMNKPPEPAPAPSAAPIAAPIGPGSKPGTVKAIVSQRYNNPLGLYSNENASTQLEGQSKFLMDKDEGSGNTTQEDFPPPPPPVARESEVDEKGRKKYVPSETFRLVQEEVGLLQKEEEPGPAHSRTFKMLQAQLNSGGGPPPAPAPTFKPTPSPSYQPSPAPVAPASAAKPWAPSPAAPPPPVVNASPRPFGSSAAPPKPTGTGATRGKRGDAAMNPAALPTAGRIPVCSGCNMPIRGPFVTALGKCWCPDHFVCANPGCGTKLLDIGFVEEGGFLYCERDYAQHFAPQCDKCGKPIIGECVNAMQKSFCPDCFLCAQCNQPIGGTKFHIEDGKFYCERDWAAMFQTMCAGCDFPIEPGDRWVEAMSKNFHSECFNCSACQVNLEGQQFCAKGGKPFCKKHAR
ncbi:PDZ and LIM domain protein 7 [Aplysia californica]|uniref:PDZ and LIM domain protein 7 n=1 Tax=Aplysia californica TaxID=6500 RepID=A0ABM0K6S0_APLCA|nr:PDZ and LIM domain protein 7 [Aplysia californica]